MDMVLLAAGDATSFPIFCPPDEKKCGHEKTNSSTLAMAKQFIYWNELTCTNSSNFTYHTLCIYSWD